MMPVRISPLISLTFLSRIALLPSAFATQQDPEKGMCVAKCSRGCHGQCREGGFRGCKGCINSCWGGCGSRYRGGVQAHERTGAGAIDPHNVALRPITFLEEGNVGQKI